jgi:hypothetical protein
LILNILESIKLYPLEYLIINNKGKQYTEKGLQKMLFELVPDKNIGFNALRSMYTSYWLTKLNKSQINRVAFLMRTSFTVLSTSYLKKNEDEEEAIIINKNNEKITTTNTNRQQQTTKAPRDRKAYLNEYYKNTADTVDKLRLLHAEGELEYNKEFRPSLQQEADFWESDEGRNLLLDPSLHARVSRRRLQPPRYTGIFLQAPPPRCP